MRGYGGTEGLPLTLRMRIALWLTRDYQLRAFTVARQVAEENTRLAEQNERLAKALRLAAPVAKINEVWDALDAHDEGDR